MYNSVMYMYSSVMYMYKLSNVLIFSLEKKKELSSGVVVYFALSL